MQCSIPPPLTEDQLSATLDGLADSHIQAHLTQCPGCAARLVEARQAEHRLKAQLFRWNCPPSQQLGNYHLGLISGAEERAIVRHLEQCAACTADVEELHVFLAADTVPKTQPVPTPAQRSRPRLRELIANRLPRTPAVALRGAGHGPIMAEADGTTIILDVQPLAEGSVVLMGQIAADDQDRWTGALVELRQDGALQTTATVDDLGSFQLKAATTSRVDLRVTSEQGTAISLPNVDLTAS